MATMSRLLRLLRLSLFAAEVSAVQIWSSPGAIPTTIPAGCRAALSQNITCAPDLVSARFVAGGRALDGSTLNQYCTTACYNSIISYQSIVNLRCGNTQYQMFFNSTLSQTGPSVADPLPWAYNVTCLQDTTGFCLASLYNGTKTACSDCALQYGAAMLNSKYGRAKVQPSAFSSLLSSCGVPSSKYPFTAVPTSSTSTTPATSTPIATCAGTPYTAGAQDTCQSIAQSNSIATDRLIANNGLDYNCTSLTAGMTLCLGPTCSLQTITTNQTCSDIIGNQTYGVVQLVSWNPTIHTSCDNLDVMVGRSICVSPPGNAVFSATPLNITTATMSSMFPGPYITGSVNSYPPNVNTSWYNTQTTFNATPTTTFVVNTTAASLIAARTSLCPISDDLYAAGFSDADLPGACQALILPYCWPDPDAPVPTSTRFPAVCTPSVVTASPASTTAANNAVPSPLEPQTNPNCRQYYRVLDGDNCYSIASNFKITLDQFNLWNPYPGTTCSKLFLGYYVCVLL